MLLSTTYLISGDTLMMQKVWLQGQVDGVIAVSCSSSSWDLQIVG